ncbi:hypothetical protein [Acidocella sp.]|uniref:hypothetical protein n=1 Tax=Acidocella sp. TaxID=50710 RepID=UPI001833703F|nr:hypothetical protein [Acidocella sp.]NNM56499.1 hypothetical protein [Acidocella sp.]
MNIDEEWAEISDFDAWDTEQAMVQHVLEIKHGAIFSFRAECRQDVSEFERRCHIAGLQPLLTIHKVENYPDVHIEMRTVASIEKLKTIMRRVIDSHVMIETLRECPLAENSLEREYECDNDGAARRA